MAKRIIAVDFDDTIHDTKNVDEGKKMGRPMEGAKEALEQLQDNRCKIVVHSCNRLEAIADWMDYWEIPYNDITDVKPMADAYIDDKGIHFTNWKDVLEILL